MIERNISFKQAIALVRTLNKLISVHEMRRCTREDGVITAHGCLAICRQRGKGGNARWQYRLRGYAYDGSDVLLALEHLKGGNCSRCHS